MKDEDDEAFDDGQRLEGGIRTAVAAWCADRDAAKDQYGPIASWNISEITNMRVLFYTKLNTRTGYLNAVHVRILARAKCKVPGKASCSVQDSMPIEFGVEIRERVLRLREVVLLATQRDGDDRDVG